MDARMALVGRGLNRDGWEPVLRLLRERNVSWGVHEAPESLTEPCDLGLLLGCSRLLPPETLNLARLGFVVLHYSDLPLGRGFAPIYNTLTRGLPLVQTLLFAANGADSGDILAKARYPLDGDETEEEVRRIDDALSVLLLEATLDDLLAGAARGVPQDEARASWWPRRRAEDSRLDPTRSVAELFDHLRALPAEAPAFFEHRGRRFALRLEALGPARDFDPRRVILERHND